MLFVIKPTGQGLREINQFFFKISLVLTICAQIGWLLDNGTSAPAIFLIFFTAIRYHLKNWLNPLWICLHSWSLLYVEVPCLWYSIAGRLLNPEEGLSSVKSNFTYSDFAPALLWLSFFYLAFIALKIFKEHAPIKPMPDFIFNDQTFYRLLSVCLVLLGICFFRELGFAANKLDNIPGFVNEVIRFFIHDAAILFALCLLNMGRLNAHNTRSVVLLQGLLLLIYLCFFTIMGSKGAIITALFLCIIIPIACAPILGFREILVPKFGFAAVLASVAPLLFFLGQLFRSALGQKSATFGDFESAWQLNFNNLGDLSVLMQTILYRISAELNRYLLLATDFFQNGDNPMRMDLMQYISKNTANLLLPGTPFPENFYMSSMLLPSLLSQIPLGSGDYYELGSQLNSQPYTIFGLLMFFFGNASPLIFLLFSFVIYWFLRGGTPLVAIGGLLFFQFSLSMYGLEVCVLRALMFVANIFLILKLSRFLETRKRRVVPPSVSVRSGV